MAPTQATSGGIITLQSGLKLSIWAATLFAALSITSLSGNWGHSVCGVWGCGPPTQVLIGCHLAWLVVLVPLSTIISRFNLKDIGSPQNFGKLLFITGATLVVAVVLYQGATWWPMVGDRQRNYFLQRCGFVIVTSVDIPMLQLLAIGLWLMRRKHRLPIVTD
jgi:hypothetical protein